MKRNKPCRASLAIEYRCHECMGGYQDGHADCEIPDCALYAWMPYRRLEPDIGFLEYSPRGTGHRQRKGGKRDTSATEGPTAGKDDE